MPVYLKGITGATKKQIKKQHKKNVARTEAYKLEKKLFAISFNNEDFVFVNKSIKVVKSLEQLHVSVGLKIRRLNHNEVIAAHYLYEAEGKEMFLRYIFMSRQSRKELFK